MIKRMAALTAVLVAAGMSMGCAHTTRKEQYIVPFYVNVQGAPAPVQVNKITDQAGLEEYAQWVVSLSAAELKQQTDKKKDDDLNATKAENERLRLALASATTASVSIKKADPPKESSVPARAFPKLKVRPAATGTTGQ